METGGGIHLVQKANCDRSASRGRGEHLDPEGLR